MSIAFLVFVFSPVNMLSRNKWFGVEEFSLSGHMVLYMVLYKNPYPLAPTIPYMGSAYLSEKSTLEPKKFKITAGYVHYRLKSNFSENFTRKKNLGANGLNT